MINHLGGPGGVDTSAAKLAQWKADIADVASSCPNVVMKCGGIQMVNSGRGFEQRPAPIGSEELCAAVLPFYQHVISHFTPQRCMFESNFPPDKECVSHRVLYNAFKRIANAMGLSAADKRDIFHDTAVKAYRLDEPFGAALTMKL